VWSCWAVDLVAWQPRATCSDGCAGVVPRWDRRLRIVLNWTVALFFRPDITKVELRVEPNRRLARARWRPAQ
jgi:hypothetical protein